jgi:3'(2'), 5'-bisphosphate nucleotidase
MKTKQEEIKMNIDKRMTEKLVMEAIRASVDAGMAILEVYESDFTVSNKTDNSPLTMADMKAHRVISDMLEKTNIPILSEEGKHTEYSARKNWDLFWLVDPLDGTKEFVKKNGEFTVNIALIEDQYPIAGVIYIPVIDVLFIGIRSHGARKIQNAKELLQNPVKAKDILNQGNALPEDHALQKYTVVCSRSHMSGETETFIEELRTTHGELDFASRGSSLKLCMVAEGAANIYPRFAPTMEWDTAAGQAIAEASGATVSDAITGKRIQYNKENLLNPWFIVNR